MVELLKETKANSKYIKDQGYQLVEMWECQWRRLKRTNSAVQQFLSTTFQRPVDHHKTLTRDQLLRAVCDESLFCVVECDIRVPDDLRPKFSEMCSIFINIEISIVDLTCRPLLRNRRSCRDQDEVSLAAILAKRSC